MRSRWNDQEAAHYAGDLAQRVYTSRLLGQDPTLVMHGGGNTSVKIAQNDVFGVEEQILYVKGSGSDLSTIDASGFAPVRMEHLMALATLESLTDTAMANELQTHVTLAGAPAPSVEAILHAILPYKFVDHTHADAIIAVGNAVNGPARIQEIYGEAVVIVPYVMPGFKLARACAQFFPAQRNDHTLGMLLLGHGLFSFGDTAKESYERMIELVTRAEIYLERHHALQIAWPAAEPPARPLRTTLAGLRREVSDIAGVPLIMRTTSDDRTLGFARRPDVAALSQHGPATPDHVIRTRRVPLIGRDLPGYKRNYQAYFAEHAGRSAQPLTMLDPAPRVILDPAVGLITLGPRVKDALIALDIYDSTIDIVMRATALGGWTALPEADLFDVEYWDLEQAKLRRAGKPLAFTGEIALVTGAASGIGKACAESFMARGAAVVGLDINPDVAHTFERPEFLGIRCNVTDESAITEALEQGVCAFGGLDMLVLNAGIFPGSKRIEALTLGDWQKVMHVNVDANLILMHHAHPLLDLSPRGGRVVIVGSKNVPAPGPGQAAYSASKAALTQLARVAALEWGENRIRVNIVHPNAVFDTGLWTEDVLRSRAEHYGVSVEEYKRNNVLKVAITSHDVGELVVELCGPTFSKTTGAQIPIDGGNDRVI
jgi:rhamnose utilization protein RhaD (predicted bifunctional aldolase and dehydrogenase)/NAD(P)-dependent dehydrogenase (short-subunit alcohol dehydrogenase family)